MAFSHPCPAGTETPARAQGVCRVCTAVSEARQGRPRPETGRWERLLPGRATQTPARPAGAPPRPLPPFATGCPLGHQAGPFFWLSCGYLVRHHQRQTCPARYHPSCPPRPFPPAGPRRAPAAARAWEAVRECTSTPFSCPSLLPILSATATEGQPRQAGAPGRR